MDDTTTQAGGGGLKVSVSELRAERDRLRGQIEAIVRAAEPAGGLSEQQRARADAARERLTAIDDRLGEIAEQQERSADAARAFEHVLNTPPTRPGYHTGGGHVYGRDDHRTSWLKDMVRARLQGDQAAYERLQRNNHEFAVEHRALSATDGAGGDFVPPVWLVDQWVKLARPGRVVADQVTKMALPEGTDTINLPRIATGTATAAQATQNTNVAETDATTDIVTAAVETIAGAQTLSLQMVEQSPVAVDQILLQDLMADLATKVDGFVINNNAANKRGLLNVTGVNAVTYTDTTPTVGELYPKIADAIQLIHTGRFMPPTRIFMHPRRWAWFTAAVDTQTRPLVVPVANMPQNAIAAMGTVVSEGFVGSIQGVPTFVDPNIPTNLGAGVNEDRIIVCRAEDVHLMESAPRAQVFPEPLAKQMSVLLRVYEYVAVHSERYPKAISVISGTGLVPPVF